MKSPTIFSLLSKTTLLLVLIVLTETIIVSSSSSSSSSYSSASQQQQQQQQQPQHHHHQQKKLRGLITTDTTADTTNTTTDETLQQQILREQQLVREPQIIDGSKVTTIINDTETTIAITITNTTTTDDETNEDTFFFVLPGDTSPTYGASGGAGADADTDAASGGSTLSPRCLVCGSNSRTVRHPTTILELPNGSLSSCSALEAAGRLGLFSSTYCSTTIIPLIVDVCGGCTVLVQSSPVYVMDSTDYADYADLEYWSQAATNLWDGAVDWVTVFFDL